MMYFVAPGMNVPIMVLDTGSPKSSNFKNS